MPMKQIEYPITVNDITYGNNKALTDYYGGNCGDMVAVRPCGDEYGDKTYLGILLGQIALSQYITFNKESGELEASMCRHNPAMFVPDINKIIYGIGSWWCVIESPDQLGLISDADIENVWYVKALKQLSGAETTNHS